MSEAVIDPSSPSFFKTLLRGMLASSPMLLVLIPFALLFGIVATEAGLDILQVTLLSVTVFAGAAQFTAVQLMQDHAPVIVVLATALAVNLRLAMYSASLLPHLGKLPNGWRGLVAFLLVDQSYITSISEYERVPSMPARLKLAYFLGSVALIAPIWVVCTIVGAVVGTQLPGGDGLDFAMPVTFIAMIAPMLRSLPHLAAAFVAVAVSLGFSWLPYSTGILLAAACAMATGVLVETLLEKRR